MGMANRGNSGLKVIVFMGMGTFLFLMLVAFGLRQSVKPQERTRVPPGAAESPFQEARAWADLEHIVALGPRPSGSPAMAEQQKYIARGLREAGLKVRQFSFEGVTSRGALPMMHIAGIVEGERPGIILLTAHYDTLYHPEADLAGANDGASGAAWLLEMARVLGPRREGRAVWLVFLDGEEPQDAVDTAGGLRGSQQLVAALHESGELPALEALINVAMVGDCYLSISRDSGAPDWLAEIVWNTARRHGYGAHFGAHNADTADSHVAFRATGIPSLELLDSSYGASPLEHARNWHTAEDSLEKVCPESLRAVGDVIYHALPVMEGHLDTMSARSNGN